MPAKKKRKTSKTKKVAPKKDSHVAAYQKASVNMQKISVALLKSNHELGKRIDSLVKIFEQAAKNISGIEEGTQEEKIGKLSNKLETLLEQNKALAEGLFMLEKYVRAKTSFREELKPKSLT